MRQLISTIALLAFTTILGSSILDAQMMGGGHAQMSTPKTTKHAAQPADTSLADLMRNSSQMSATVMQDLSKLEARLDKALTTTDEQQREAQLKDIRSEMATLHSEMAAELQMQKHMSEIMQAGGMMEEMMMQPETIGMRTDGDAPQTDKAYN